MAQRRICAERIEPATLLCHPISFILGQLYLTRKFFSGLLNGKRVKVVMEKTPSVSPTIRIARIGTWS